jgi:hypothetical protein
LQQLAGALGVEAPFDFLAMRILQAAIRAVARQILGALMLGLPIARCSSKRDASCARRAAQLLKALVLAGN